jgi:hypothetical protein
MAEPIDLLDRQYQRLAERDGAEFIRELRPFYTFITEGPAAVVRALAQLRVEAASQEQTFQEHDQRLIPELVGLRDELVARAPEIDDSDVPRPAGRGVPSMEWQFGLANFDELATGGPDRLAVHQDLDTSASGMMLRILEHNLQRLQWTTEASDGALQPSERNLRHDLDDLARGLRNLSDRHRHAAQQFTQAIQQQGGFQVIYLDMVVREMNPAPQEVETDEEEHAWMDEAFKRVAAGWYYVQDAVAGRPLNERARQTLDIHVSRLKPAAERVYEDLRMKLATAPPVAARTTYGERLRRWVISPGYALLGGPCVAGAVTGIVQGQHAGLGVFIGLAALFGLVPPFVASLPEVTFSGASWLYAILTSAVVVFVFSAVGVVAAIVAFVILTTVFILGQRAAGHIGSTQPPPA